MPTDPLIAGPDSGLTRRLVEFVSDFAASDLPPGAADTVKLALLDTLAVESHSAAGEPGGRSWDPSALDGGGQSTIVGRSAPVTSPAAAFANGGLAHALDFDDTGASTGHPSCTLVPAGVATSEELDLSGARFITAYVVGYEIGTLLSQVIDLDRPFHRTSVVGPIAAAAACASLRGMKGESVLASLGAAAVMGGSGLRGSFGTQLKPLQVAQAARVGATAPLLAAAGWHGDEEILEGSHGFVACYSKEGLPRASEVFTDLGRRFSVTNDYGGAGVLGGAPTMKPWPCCAGTFPALLALAAANGGRPTDAAQIERIEVHAPKDPEAGALFRVEPTTPLQAKFSLRYNVALAVIDGEIGLDSFSQETYERVLGSRILERVEVIPQSPLSQGHMTHVIVHLRDGLQMVGASDGKSGLPADREHVLGKFRRLAPGVVAPGDIERVIDSVLELEERPMTEVIGYFRAETGRIGDDS